MRRTIIFAIGLIMMRLTIAQTPVPGGTIVGENWTTYGSPYLICGNVSIASLSIQPGVTVLFSGNYTFEVSGVLTAVGTFSDSIVFSQADSLNGWNGIKFNYSAPGSEMAYCIIEKSYNHGIFIDSSTPIIRNCCIENNHFTTNGTAAGGGIYGIGTITLTDCIVKNNLTHASGTYTIGQYGYGGGIYVIGNLNLFKCKILGNNLWASPDWATGHTYGGGIAVVGILNMYNCCVSNNISNGGGCQGGIDKGYGYGGGIWVNDTLNIYNSIISNNTVAGYNGRIAGGVFCANVGTSSIVNATIAYNSNEGIYSNNDTLEIINTISYFNGTSQVSGNVNVTFSDIQNGFIGEGNINYNPVFQSSTNLIIVLGSPCVDAGDPYFVYNDACFPPSLGTEINDMGAHGGPDACGWDIVLSSNTDILEYSFPEQTSSAVINQTNHTVDIEVGYGTDVASLVAFFTLSDGATASVDGVNQQSGNTINDFTSPVTYVVTAEDGATIQDWVITVDIAIGFGENYLRYFNIYPNPFAHKATINIYNQTHSNYKLTVFSISGNKVFEKDNITSDKIEFDRGELPNGIYLIELKGDKVFRGKIIVN